MHDNPLNKELIQQVVNKMLEYKKCNAASVAMLKQQSKKQWVKSEDHNSAFYHAVVKQKRYTSKIMTLQDDVGK